MEKGEERRRHKRLQLKLAVLCQKVGVPASKLFSGNTVNVSTGGALIDFNSDGISQGELISLEMTLPPTEGLLEYGGKFTSYARVIREHKPQKKALNKNEKSLALEFCESPKLEI